MTAGGFVDGVDVEWAVNEINAFLETTAQVGRQSTGNVMRSGTRMRGPSTLAAEQAHVVEMILDRVTPSWRATPPESDHQYRWLRDQASRAKAQLIRDAEISGKLGDGAPRMGAGALHPWAWDSGRPLWNTGHYVQAVTQAAIRINAETQAKLGRFDISETDLFIQAFSTDLPKPGAPRLRLMSDDGSATYRNLHRGARAFAEGIYAAIRNPAVHTLTGPVEEQVALEQLAAFSILARWVDNSHVESV